MQHNNNLPITALYANHSHLISPVGQIVEVGQRGEITSRFCTGFNFSDQGYFLTAGHCLSTSNAQICFALDHTFDSNKLRVSYNYQCQPHSDMRVCNLPTSEFTYIITNVEAHGFCYFDSDNKKLDYAVLKMEPAAASYGYLPPSYLAPKVNDDIIVVHHPEGHVKQYSVGKIQAHHATQKLIDHSAHTYGGSSGAPVISLYSQPNYAIGVHVSGTEYPNTNRVPDHLHHYAVPTKDILNSAIQNNVSLASKLGIFSRSGTRVERGVKLYDVNEMAVMPYNPPPRCC